MATATAARQVPRRLARTGSLSAWRGTTAAGCLMAIAATAGVSLSAGTPIWPAIATGGAFAVALIVLAVHPGRAGALIALLAGGLLLGPAAREFPQAFGWVQDPFEFTAAATTVIALALIVAGAGAVLVFGQRAAEPYERATPRGLIVLALLLVGAAVATSAALRMTVPAVTAGRSDVVVEARHLRYPVTVDAKAGEKGNIALLIRNADRGAHTFTVDRLGVDAVVAGTSSTRIVTPAAPGTYAVRCRIPRHDGMSTTLHVR